MEVYMMNFGPTPLEARQHVRRTIAEATLEGQNIQIQIKLLKKQTNKNTIFKTNQSNKQNKTNI